MIRGFLRAAVFAVAFACAGAAFADKSFTRNELASEGVHLEDKLRAEAGNTAAGRSVAVLRRDAEVAARSDTRRALTLLGAAVVLDPKDPASWLAYAKATRA